MRKTNNIYILISCSILFFSCSSVTEQSKKSNTDMMPTYDDYKQQLDNLNKQFLVQNRRVDSIFTEINFLNNNQYELLVKLNNKIAYLDKVVTNHDSLYSSILIELSSLEDNIISLGHSYNEIAQIKSNDKIEEIPIISSVEFREKYIESLEAYQNANWDISMEGFVYLLMLNNDSDLADNCQYWIAEIFYKKKKYHQAIIEFEKVKDEFPGSDKIDDSIYQLANCYLKLGNKEQAEKYLLSLISEYQDSEYVKKANYLLER